LFFLGTNEKKIEKVLDGCGALVAKR
jgi:hypothetical protein